MITEARLVQLEHIIANGTCGPWKVGRPTFRCTTVGHDHANFIPSSKDCHWVQSGWDDDHSHISVDCEYTHEDFLDMWEIDKEDHNLPKSGALITGGIGWDDGEGHIDGGILRSFNTVAIVEMRNAFPTLLEEVIRLRRELKKKDLKKRRRTR